MSRRRTRCGTPLIVGLLVVCAWSLATQDAEAAREEAPPSANITSVDIGFDDIYKVGYWTPLHVSFTTFFSKGPWTVEATVPDVDGVANRVVGAVVISEDNDSESDGAKRLRGDAELFVKVGRIDGELTVTVRRGGMILATAVRKFGRDIPAPLPADQPLVIAVGEAKTFVAAAAEHPLTRQLDVRVAQVVDPVRLPTEWFGYGGVDAVLLTGSRPQVRELVSLDRRFGALAKWVHDGGTLIMSISGDDAELIQRDGPLAALLPGRLDRLVAMREFGGLETFTGADDPLLFLDERGDVREVPTPRVVDVRGDILAFQGRQAADLPLLVRGPHGFGEVAFLPLDIEDPAFVLWNGTRALVAKMLFPSNAAQTLLDVKKPGELTQLGYDDLAGQLRAALDNFSGQGVRFLPFPLLGFLVVCYILLIAPGDYWFLRRFVGRMEFTWITFPLIIALACGGAYLLARAMKGDQLHLNKAEVVDVDLRSGTYRGTCWFSIFSPQTSVYDLSLKHHLPTGSDQADEASGGRAGRPTVLLSWMGLPGTGLGGMRSTAAPPELSNSYQYSPELDVLDGVPIQIWSTKNFSARLRGGAPDLISADLAVRASGSEQLLTGTITSNMDVTLSDCVLFHDRWVYLLGKLPAGRSAEINNELVVRTVGSYLRRLGPWTDENDQQRADVRRILARMMFYEAAGGIEFIPLKNRYQGFVDLSRQLTPDQAILVGFADRPAFSVYDGDEDLAPEASGQTTVYRIKIPIARPKSERSPPSDNLQEETEEAEK